MRCLASLSLKRLLKNVKSVSLTSLAVLVSSALIACFLGVLFVLVEIKAAIPNFPIYDSGIGTEGAISLNKFVSDVMSYVALSVSAVTVITLVTLFVYIRMTGDEKRKFYSIITSLGATRAQKLTVAFTESTLAYFVPCVFGTVIGAIFARGIGSVLEQTVSENFKITTPFLIISLLIAVLGGALIYTSAFFEVCRGRESVIEGIRGYNREEAEAHHSYRKSYTFRNMPVEKRIAKKSVEYYRKPYRRISIAVAGCILYPVLAVLFYIRFASVGIITDTNPYDSIDTSLMAENVIMTLALFVSVGFLILFAVGFIQTVLMLRTQSRLRRTSLLIYRSVGLSHTGIKRVLRYEYKTVIFNAMLFVIIGTFAVLLAF